MGLCAQWGTIGEALPPAHAGVVEGPKSPCTPFPCLYRPSVSYWPCTKPFVRSGGRRTGFDLTKSIFRRGNGFDLIWRTSALGRRCKSPRPDPLRSPRAVKGRHHTSGHIQSSPSGQTSCVFRMVLVQQLYVFIRFWDGVVSRSPTCTIVASSCEARAFLTRAVQGAAPPQEPPVTKYRLKVLNRDVPGVTPSTSGRANG